MPSSGKLLEISRSRTEPTSRVERAPSLRLGAGEFGLNSVDALLAAERSGDGRYFRVISILRIPSSLGGRNRHPRCAPESRAQMLARLLAVRDDIDPGVFLLLER